VAASAKSQVSTYVAAQPPVARRVLKRIQAAIRAAAPKAVDAFSYKIPCSRLGGAPLVWYAAWRNHVSLYPISAAMLRANGISDMGYETSKGTIRFPLDNPPSATFVKRLVKARVAEIRKSG
jgi:uncharacterized protein YdhG (YjbR/CyaY superfamily)